jgi:hypothetical protein
MKKVTNPEKKFEPSSQYVTASEGHVKLIDEVSEENFEIIFGEWLK